MYQLAELQFPVVPQTRDIVPDRYVITPQMNSHNFKPDDELLLHGERVINELRARSITVEDSPGVGIQHWFEDDSGQLLLWFRHASYSSVFAGHAAKAFSGDLDPVLRRACISIRDLYVREQLLNVEPHDPMFFSMRPQCTLTIVTADNKLLTVRDLSVTPDYPGVDSRCALVFDILPDRGDCEGVEYHNMVTAAAMRTLRERLGLALTPDVDCFITYLFASDNTRFDQPIVAGCATTHLTSLECNERIAAAGVHVPPEYLWRPFTMDWVFQYLKDQPMLPADQLAYVCALKSHFSDTELWGVVEGS